MIVVCSPVHVIEKEIVHKYKYIRIRFPFISRIRISPFMYSNMWIFHSFLIFYSNTYEYIQNEVLTILQLTKSNRSLFLFKYRKGEREGADT